MSGLEDRLDLAAQHRVDPPHPRRRFEAGEDLASLLGGRASFWVRGADGQSEGEPGLGHVEEHAQLTETLNRFPEAADGLGMSSLQRCHPSAQEHLLDLDEPSTHPGGNQPFGGRSCRSTSLANSTAMPATIDPTRTKMASTSMALIACSNAASKSP